MTTEGIRKRLDSVRTYLQWLWDCIDRYERNGMWEIRDVYIEERAKFERKEAELAALKRNPPPERTKAVKRRKSIANHTKTHCPKGHEYTPENTYRRYDGKRKCRACAKAAYRRATG